MGENLGGYGRPPAEWLIGSQLGEKSLSFSDVAHLTGVPKTAVRRICEKYSEFLRIKYKTGSTAYLLQGYVTGKRLKLLHDILSADYYLRQQMRQDRLKRPHKMPSAFRKFLVVAQNAGFQGIDDMWGEKNRIVISDYRAEILSSLRVK
jgi:hypothetical protein